MTDGISTAEALMLGKQNQDGGLFGGSGTGGGLWAFLIFAMIFGGGNLFGFGGRNAAGVLANEGITNDFLFNNLSRGQQLGFDQISNSLSHGFESTTNSLAHMDSMIDSGFANVQNSFCATNTNMLNGFAGLQNTINDKVCQLNSNMTQGFTNTTAGITDLGWKMQQCCCETNRNLDSIKYENAKNTCDIITSGNANTQRMIDWLTQEKICSLNSELQSAQNALSNCNQTQTILNNLGKYVPYYSCPLGGHGGAC